MIDFGKGADLLRERLKQIVADYVNLKGPPVTRLDLDIWLGDGGDSPPAATVHLDTTGNDWPGEGSHPSFATIAFPHWMNEYGRDEGEVRAMNGSIRKVTSAKRDQIFHGFFVDALLAARDAGVFDRLPKSPTCELGVVNFDCGFFWPEESDRGLMNMADARHNGTRLSNTPSPSADERIKLDERAYDLWVEVTPTSKTTAVVGTAAALGIGLSAARELVESGSPLLRDESALEVQRVAKLLRERGLEVRFDPPFPYPLNA